MSRKGPSLHGACLSGPCSELAALRVRTPARGVAWVSRRLSLPLPPSCRASLQEPGQRATRAGCQCGEVMGRHTVSARKPSAVSGPVCRTGGPACLKHDGCGQELRTQLSQSPAARGQAHGLSWATRTWALVTSSLIGLGSLLPSRALPPAPYQLFCSRPRCWQ